MLNSESSMCYGTIHITSERANLATKC